VDTEPAPPLSRGLSGQRRYVTVLFSDICGSSGHAEMLEAEEYSLLLEQFRQFARQIVPRHGGCVARLQGDGVLALFGHLEPREDDGRRAVEAALELHAAVGRLHAGRGEATVVLQMHSGIHGGMVLLIEGDIERPIRPLASAAWQPAATSSPVRRRWDPMLTSSKSMRSASCRSEGEAKVWTSFGPGRRRRSSGESTRRRVVAWCLS
jgi:Adenylate and Guanylate cyclase catalytic domain